MNNTSLKHNSVLKQLIALHNHRILMNAFALVNPQLTKKSNRMISINNLFE